MECFTSESIFKETHSLLCESCPLLEGFQPALCVRVCECVVGVSVTMCVCECEYARMNLHLHISAADASKQVELSRNRPAPECVSCRDMS